MRSHNKCFWARMTILYLRYCAIYPPQVVLRKRQKKRLCLLIRQRHGRSSLQYSTFLSICSSAWPRGCSAKRNILLGRIDPGYVSADAVFHAWLSRSKNWPHSFLNLLLTMRSHKMQISVNSPSLFLLFWFRVLIFLHCDTVSKDLWASKTQTSNAISTPTTSNEPWKIFPIKGPGGRVKPNGRKAPSLSNAVMLWRRDRKERWVVQRHKGHNMQEF